MNPPRNRKGGAGNPPPKGWRAPVLSQPSRNTLHSFSQGAGLTGFSNPSPDAMSEELSSSRQTEASAFSLWNEIFGDPVVATTILDRVLHHSATITIKGNSYRPKENVKAALLREPGLQQH